MKSLIKHSKGINWYLGTVSLIIQKLIHCIGSGLLFLIFLWQELSNTVQSYSTAPVYIQAHKNELACIALNQQGTRLATASDQGTLIRVWDTTTRNQLVELRRGTDSAAIHW